MNRNIVVLGGGLAGLSVAYHSGGFVYEKQGFVGGTCISPEVDGFIFDLGIHVLHTRDKYVLELLIDILKCRMQTKRRSAWIYSNNVMTKYPFQVNTFGLPRDIKKSCIEGFKKTCRVNIAKTDYKNYEEWIYSKFGKGIAKHFYLPYSEKFWTVSAREMTTDWLDVRVPVPQLKDVLEGSQKLYEKEYGPNALFRYPLKSGISKIPESFVHRLNNKIFLNKEAISLSFKNKSIRFKNGTVLFYDSLVSTIPIPELFNIIQEMAPSHIKNAVKSLRCNSILCVNIGMEKVDIHPSHWIYYPEKDYVFFRISFPKNFCKSLAPRGCSSITAEISYSEHKDIDKKGIVDRTINDLIKAKILKDKARIKVIDVRDVKYGYPIYDHNRKDSMKLIDDYLRRFNIFLAGRYGRWEYQWMHDAILDGRRVAQEVINT